MVSFGYNTDCGIIYWLKEGPCLSDIVYKSVQVFPQHSPMMLIKVGMKAINTKGFKGSQFKDCLSYLFHSGWVINCYGVQVMVVGTKRYIRLNSKQSWKILDNMGNKLITLNNLVNFIIEDSDTIPSSPNFYWSMKIASVLVTTLYPISHGPSHPESFILMVNEVYLRRYSSFSSIRCLQDALVSSAFWIPFSLADRSFLFLKILSSFN